MLRLTFVWCLPVLGYGNWNMTFEHVRDDSWLLSRISEKGWAFLWGIVDSCSKLNSIILKVTNINETYRELLLLLFSYESERILLKIKQPIQTKRQKSLRTLTKRQASHKLKTYRLGQQHKNKEKKILQLQVYNKAKFTFSYVVLKNEFPNYNKALD